MGQVIVKIRGNAGHQNFLLFPKHFQCLFYGNNENKGLSGKGQQKSNRLTLSQTTFLDSSKLKEFADNNFKSDENG